MGEIPEYDLYYSLTKSISEPFQQHCGNKQSQLIALQVLESAT